MAQGKGAALVADEISVRGDQLPIHLTFGKIAPGATAAEPSTFGGGDTMGVTTGRFIRIVGMVLLGETASGTLTFTDSSDGAILPVVPVATGGGMSCPDRARGYVDFPSGKGAKVTAATAQVTFWFWWVSVDGGSKP